jgi:hypothetical protein
MNVLIDSDTETETPNTNTMGTTSRSIGTHTGHVPTTGETGWHEISNYPEFVKWQYADSPYRVVSYLGDRGHWRAIFTSWYDSGTYLIRGACGGGNRGRMLAVAAAKEFLKENSNGCPPPGQYE